MRQADLDRIAAIEDVSFSSPWSKVMLAAAMGFSNAFNFVVEKEGDLLAYIFSRIVEDELHIINLAVIREMRRKGLARKLLRHTIDLAVSNEVTWIYLEVRVQNLAAIRLYESEGFSIIRLIPRYYEDGQNAFEMGFSVRGDSADSRR